MLGSFVLECWMLIAECSMLDMRASNVASLELRKTCLGFCGRVIAIIDIIAIIRFIVIIAIISVIVIMVIVAARIIIGMIVIICYSRLSVRS